MDRRLRRNIRAWLRPDGGSAVAILLAFHDFTWLRGGKGAVILHLGRVASRYGRRHGNLERAVDAFDRLVSRGVVHGSREGAIARIAHVDLSGVRRHPAVEPRIGDRAGVDDEHLYTLVSVLETHLCVLDPDGGDLKLQTRTWRKRVRLASVVYLAGQTTPAQLHMEPAAVVQ